MSRTGRPRAVTGDIGKTIGEIRVRHPNWSVRDIQKKIPEFKPSLADKVPGHTAINNYIRHIVDPEIAKINKSGIEKAWTSAALNEEPISPDAIHWLIKLQEFYRKLYYSKPLTIREARWFNRLSGFREEFSYNRSLGGIGMFFNPFPPDPSDLTIAILGKDRFFSHVIATWAQLYAYREKIDNIAGIKEPDYSDLDSELATGQLSAINDYNQKSFEYLMTKMTRGPLTKGEDKYFLLSMIDAIRFIEILILYHSLGDPDMSTGSINSYFGGLSVFEDTAFRQRLMELPYILRIRFLVLLREWAKEHPDANDAMIKPKVKIILDKVEKEGEANGKR